MLPLGATTEENSAQEEKLDLLSTQRAISPAGLEKGCRELVRESDVENVEFAGSSADGDMEGMGTLEVNPFLRFRLLLPCNHYARGHLVSLALTDHFSNSMLD
jgi:restriction system protein